MQFAFTRLAQAMAILGGSILLFVIVMTCVSILGRELKLGEITGNYEILEAGIAFAIFSFLPICQLHGGHATVDVFTMGLGARWQRVLKAIWEIVLTAVIIFLTWRLFGGLERYLRNEETTFFLQFPVWWSYLASFLAALVASIVACYCALMRIGEVAQGRAILPEEG